MKMKTWLLIGALIGLASQASAQVFWRPDARWQTRGVGPLASRPATCTANRDVWMCNGSGCGTNGEYHYCTAANTWTVASGVFVGGQGALGTVGAISKVTAPGVLGESVIADSGTAVTITQNSVVPFTSLAAGAVTDTLYLKEGNVGIGTATPQTSVHIRKDAAAALGPELLLQNASSGIGAAGKVSVSSINPTNYGRLGEIESQVVRGDYSSDWIIRNWTTPGGLAERVRIKYDGKVGIGTDTPTSMLQVVGLPIYANNAAAVAGGLTAGAFYRTNADPDPVCVVH